MITTFKTAKRPHLFPVKWANSVVDWISGVHSKTGTLKITNTLNPNEDGSLSIDIDIEELARMVEKSLLKRATEASA